MKRALSKAKKSIKQTKNNLLHAHSGNGPLSGERSKRSIKQTKNAPFYAPNGNGSLHNSYGKVYALQTSHLCE